MMRRSNRSVKGVIRQQLSPVAAPGGGGGGEGNCPPIFSFFVLFVCCFLLVSSAVGHGLDNIPTPL